MSQSTIDFLNLFVLPPGDLIYFLAVVGVSQAGLLMALGERLRHTANRAARRYALAGLGTVLAWLLLLAGAVFAILTGQSAVSIIPPLERAAHVLVILLVGWAFLTADHDRWGRLPNLALLVLMLIVIGGYVITGWQWATLYTQVDFNLSPLGLAWTVIPMALAVLGIILLITYFRVVTDAPLKLVFFVVLLVGYGFTLFQITQGNLLGSYAGPARLAFLAALPIFPAVIYRMVVGSLQAEVFFHTTGRMVPLVPPDANALVEPPSVPILPASNLLQPPISAAPLLSPIQRDSVQLLKTLGLILEEANPADIPQRIITAALEVLKGDVGAILTLQDANYADIIAAYDRTGRRPLNAIALNLDSQPTLVNAIERRMQRPLYPDRNVDELRDLFNRLDVNDTGPVYFQPLVSGKELVAILLVGMPYTHNELHEAERELLKGIGIIAGGLLALSFAARDARLRAEERAIQALVEGVPLENVQEHETAAARLELQASLQLSQEQVRELTRQIKDLKLELDRERERVSSVLGDTQEGLSISQRIIALNDEQQQLRDERDLLIARLREAETALAGATAADNETMLKTMNEVLRREKQELEAQRVGLQTQLDDLRGGEHPPIPQTVQDMLDNMIHEKARLEVERDQLTSSLADIESQLRALGIEGGGAGLAQLVQQLTEQLAKTHSRNEALQLERDALFNERQRMADRFEHETERDTRLNALQNELANLAADREALTRERDQVKTERDEFFTKLDLNKQQTARLIAQASGYQLELGEAHEEQAKLRAQFQQLANERSSLIAQRDRLLAEKQAFEVERDQLLARLEGDRERLQQLGDDGVGSLTRMIEELSDQRSQLELELYESRSQLAQVQNQLDALQLRANAEPLPRSTPFSPDLVLGMTQELRTPMSSIIGYVDLLLDESAGILGEMQRKFLQRIASNLSRITAQLDDFTRLTALDSGRLTLLPEPIDVIELIEDAFTASSHQFRERDLIAHLNLDDNIPRIRADRDAISQIINELLTNAYLASPPGNQVIIGAHRQEVKLSVNNNFSTPTDSLLISVEDRGGGIAPDDVARVFARKYKADNPAIPGLGDNGVGLSLARTLAEAHGGGLWFESRTGMGSIFYFALPIKTVLEPEG